MINYNALSLQHYYTGLFSCTMLFGICAYVQWRHQLCGTAPPPPFPLDSL